tara:strand:- start:2281 stop:2820 length:540 start_codon:yes stop_codon:yes gene_type:complete
MVDKITGECCPVCAKKTLTMIEDEKDIPYFGKVFIFSMSCSKCGFHKSDVEADELKDPCKLTFTIEKEDDLKVRFVKSSEASVKISQLRMSVEPGASSNGYVSNLEGLLNRFEKILEDQRDGSDDKDVRKKAKNLLKKIRKVKYGEAPLKIVIEDPTGNSAIISEKTKVEKLKLKSKKI